MGVRGWWVLLFWVLLTAVVAGLFVAGIQPILLLPVFFLFYFVGAWLLTVPAGACPLRWWPVAGWVALISIAHLYCLLLILKISLNNDFVLTLPVATGSAGAIAGLLLRRYYRFRQCSCKHAQLNIDVRDNHSMQPFTGRPDMPAFITHLPGLPDLVAHSFGWKRLTLHIDNNWRLDMVCTGKSLVSLPHFSYGALFHAGSPKASSCIEVSDFLKKLHEKNGFNGLEFRTIGAEIVAAFPKVVSYLPLQQEAAFQRKGFSANLRSKISRGKRHGFEVLQGGPELLHDFYRVYARRLHELGSGALPRQFFARLLFHYAPSQAVVFVLKKQGKVVGGAFNLHYRGFYENAWFSSLKAVQGKYASYVLHDAMIEHAISLGCHTYSFGRSTFGEGVYRFKHQWGCSDLPLSREMFPTPAIDLRRQRWLSAVWRLLPYTLARPLGSRIAKWMY